MDVSQVFTITLILCCAGLLQTCFGFGFGMFSIPLLMWNGVELVEAVTFVMCVGGLNVFMGVCRYQKDAPPAREMAAPVIARLIGLPIGALVLFQLDQGEVIFAKQVVAFVILFALGCKLIQSQIKKPVDHFPRLWITIPTFFASGFLLGSVGMGGGPMSLWVYARNWDQKKVLGFCFLLAGFALPLHCGILFYRYGPRILDGMLIAIVPALFVMAITLVGNRLVNYLPRRLILTSVYVVLVTFATIALIGA